MLVNQGPLAIAFFEVTALIVLLVLFLLLRRDHADSYLRLWLLGWVSLTGLYWLTDHFDTVADLPGKWRADDDAASGSEPRSVDIRLRLADLMAAARLGSERFVPAARPGFHSLAIRNGRAADFAPPR